jgi:hypothetical protein
MTKNMVELADGTIFVTVSVVHKLLSYVNGSDAIALYTFYQYHAKRQKTNRPRAVDRFSLKGLGWGRKRLANAKKILEAEGLIKTILWRSGGKIAGWYVHVNYIFKKSTTEQLESILEKKQVPEKNSVEIQESSCATCGKEPTNALSLADGINTQKRKKGKIYKDSYLQKVSGDSTIRKEVVWTERLTRLSDKIKFKLCIQEFAESEKKTLVYMQKIDDLINDIGPDIFWKRFQELEMEPFYKSNFNKTKFIYEQIRGYIVDDFDEQAQIIERKIMKAASPLRDIYGKPLETQQEWEYRLKNSLILDQNLGNLWNLAYPEPNLDKLFLLFYPDFIREIDKYISDNKIKKTAQEWIEILGKDCAHYL